jgi:hypothetical protein
MVKSKKLLLVKVTIGKINLSWINEKVTIDG